MSTAENPSEELSVEDVETQIRQAEQLHAQLTARLSRTGELTMADQD
ncbi:hypothetical protein [Nesterenkonia sphaerica]|nr:hypothetical protein [Nesterenkonia sphaerica]